MKILDGKKLSQEIKAELKTEVLELKEKGIVPGLSVIIVGNDEASKIYVRNKKRACEEVGICSQVYELEESVSEEDLLTLIEKINKDEKVHGVLVQLPLPKHINETNLILAIDPKKDVDCFHPENLGKMFLNCPRFLPCTPAGIMEIFEKYKIEVSGKDIVIIGKSNIVGKPLAFMLMNQDATLTICHAKTKNLKEKCLKADIIITATGETGLITSDMVKKDVVIVDIGMSRDDAGKVLGDVDFSEVSKMASAITPVPGGVGPMTIAMLLRNSVQSAKIHNLRKYESNESTNS